MIRLNLVLLLAVLASALYLVRVQYESRRLYVEIERAQSEARRLETDRERLTAEKRGQATPLRVERLAKEQLQMRPASPAVTLYVSSRKDAAAPAPAPGSGTP
jgi:cell division protein FtsL